jgi:maltose alpha-D-glucosyltransferase/alpha-amylase
LRDVAGMLRSFDYAAWAALDHVAALAHEPSGHLIEAARAWHRRARRDFMESYEAVAQSSPGHSASGSSAAAHLELFLLQKALYEIAYEASSRPTWLAIPLRGVLDLLEEQGKQP